MTEKAELMQKIWRHCKKNNKSCSCEKAKTVCAVYDPWVDNYSQYMSLLDYELSFRQSREFYVRGQSDTMAQVDTKNVSSGTLKALKDLL